MPFKILGTSPLLGTAGKRPVRLVAIAPAQLVQGYVRTYVRTYVRIKYREAKRSRQKLKKIGLRLDSRGGFGIPDQHVHEVRTYVRAYVRTWSTHAMTECGCVRAYVRKSMQHG